MDSQNKYYIEGINPLRFFAALGIIIYHGTVGQTGKFPAFIIRFVNNLPICVDFFFIISGFLIIYLLLVEKEKANKISISNFYLRRILRIFPLYYLVVFIAFLQTSSFVEEGGFIKYLLFGGNFSMIENNQWPDISILSPLWSICIEEHFYLVIPFAFLLISMKNIPKFLIGIIVASILFRFYAFGITSKDWMYFYCHTLSRCDTIAIGGLLGYAYFQNKIKLKINPYWIPVVLMLVVFLLAVVDYNNFDGIIDVTIKKYSVIIPLAFLFLLILFNQKNGFLLKAIRENPILNYFGKISYGLYMYHMIVIYFLSQFQVLKEMPLLRLVLIIILSIIVSSLSYEFFEKQILKFKNRYKSI